MIRCLYRLPNPETAGHITLAGLKEAALAYPHLRPCPRHTSERALWQWIDRKYCEKCPNAVHEAKE